MMIKKVCILLLSALFPVSVMAQAGSGTSEATDFAPKKGEWQFSLTLGSGNFFNDADGLNFLLPTNLNSGLGLPGATLPGQSADMGIYLNLDGLGESNLANIIGIETEYFFTDKISFNAMFSMNISLTPKRDFEESGVDYNDPLMPIPNYNYVDARMTNSWVMSIGSDYNFKTKNSRITPYVGLIAGFRMARIETNTPYTGQEVAGGDPAELYSASRKAGQIWGLQGGVVAGIDFAIAKGLSLGFSVRPVVYNYSLVSIVPAGMSPFQTDNHSVQIFSMPTLKLAIRF